jgi:flavin-dependent dehydrogenase
LNPGARAILRRLGLDADLCRGARRVDGVVLTGERGVAVRGLYPGGYHGLTLCRRELDARLLECAVRAGARFEEGVAVREALVEGQGRHRTVRGALITDRGGRPIRLPAGVTIAADGRRSTLAFGLGLARHPVRPRRWAVGCYFEGVEDLGPCVEMHVRSHHYLGIAPLDGGAANACLVTANREGLEQPMSRLLQAIDRDGTLRARFARARPVSNVTVVGPLAVDVRGAGLPGLLLAGDAAGFIDPITGDGLRFALRGAELAATVALEMLEGRTARGHERLARLRAAEFHAKWRFNRTVRRLVARPSGVRFASHAARVLPSAFHRLIARAGDVALT